jgi:hypothetical protein
VIVRIITYEKSTLVNDEKYIGLDVHQATISVAVMEATGKVAVESILETTEQLFALEKMQGVQSSLNCWNEVGAVTSFSSFRSPDLSQSI